ncbi:MAG: hypothetical protein M9896_19330 [Candidatus Promineofilum sp.]|uniref:hypothetical protein n=1 Tax=Promineifilum sp. TaxID=2664178 RepID=UPI002411D018|nr:hypothetical protein [Promineifilum sp.]
MESNQQQRERYPTAADDLSGWRGLAYQELARLNGLQWARKRKDTIVALVDAHLAGQSEETVWGRDDTCNRSTWHSKWKKDPLMAEVLKAVDSLANGWKDKRQTDALAEAARILQLESPDSVRRVVQLRDNSDDDRVRLQASFGILDRAGVETAMKSTATTTHELSDKVEAAIGRIYGEGVTDGDDGESA